MVAKTWDNGAFSSNWGDANNWNPNGVPASTDDVTLSSASTLSITLNVSATIKSLTISGDTKGQSHDATLTLNAGTTLTTSSGISLSNSRSFISGAGTINAGTGISGSGTITASGGTLESLRNDQRWRAASYWDFS